MSIANLDKIEALFRSIGEIDDELIEESEVTAVISVKTGRRRLVKYGAIASGVMAVIFILFRSGKKNSQAA